MSTLLPKYGSFLFQHRRMEAAAWPHGKTRTPTARVMAVASPPANASTAEAKLNSASTPVAISGASPPAASAFLKLGVDPMLAEALPSIDVTRPSPIQAAALPAVLSGSNCAIQSYTGSGKTLSYLLPTLTLALRRAERLAADPATPRRGGVPDVPVQVLVVAPSQELAMQIMRVAKSLLPPDVGRYAVQQVIGGANPKRQAEALAMVPGPLLVVGTPGRLAEMIRSGSLRLHLCPLMVLDEADQLLASAFAEDINHISEHCGKRVKPGASADAAASAATSASAEGGPAPSRRQTVLVSATLTPSVLSRSARWCPDPRFVSAGAVPAVVAAGQAGGAAKEGENPAWGWGVRGWDGPASTFAPKVRGSAGGVESEELVPTMPPQLQHFYMVVEPRHKVDALRRTIHALGVQRALVFMNFQQRLQDAQFKLQARGMKSAALHGELPRLARSNLLNDFRRGRLRALVVSDVAARGIDVPQCDAVFHLELPSSAAHYAHRAGRTGRLSAALAAQAAAEAAAAAAAAADAAEAPAAAAPPPRPRAAAAAAEMDEFIEQAAGTVVTIVTPSERHVVDKLAAQLGVPLVEAHVSHGELRFGPPPGGYSFDRDEESDAPAGAEAESSAPSDRTSRRERRAGAGAAAEASAPGRRDAGAEASTSGRSAGASSSATAAKRSKASERPAAAAAAAASPKADGRGKAGDDGKYDIIVDEDDDIILDDEEHEENGDDRADYEILDEDLQAFKRLRPAEIRQLGAAAAGGAAAPLAVGIKLKASRKQRVILPGLEPARGGAASAARDGKAATEGGSKGGERRRESDKAAARRGGQGQGQEDASDGGRRPGTSRGEVMQELRRELEELRAEKERQKQQARARGGKGSASP
ncbi:hypothetical protein PLESTF_000533400 [Pleodorina starrii]|nr:hypothetical protein PLESTF_000533400 [Pleodorina starrii]